MGDYAEKEDENEIRIAPTPRQYQIELAEKAKEENVIVVLETGCGKTLISILLMREMAIAASPNKKVCVFLAPQVVLVHQQARVIQDFTDLKVGIYCGDDAKHLKNHLAWERELLQHNVLVMTPQVLLHCLCHCFIRMDSISLLIFDECHYAQLQSNHPYAEIMKIFYNPNVVAQLPRIFGMTASPICGKGASIHGLQALLHAKVYTVTDKRELEAVVVSPVVQVYHYTSNAIFSTSHTMFLDELEGIKRQCISVLCRSGDDPSRLQSAKKFLQRLHNNMVFTLTSLGFWGALQACHVLLNGDGWAINEQIDGKRNASDDLLQNEYIVKAASLLQAECMGDIPEGTADMLCNKPLKEPLFSQKVLRLVGILSNFRSRPDMKCIIFVNRIIIARSLAYVLGQMEILSSWKCNYLVGVHSKRMSRNTMNQILEEFRSGKLNLLVATKVGEEGLDIQTCCLVIRFDLPETLASFIQSRGRARMPQSEYAFLVDSENEKEMNLMESFRKDEDVMNMDIRDRKPNGVLDDVNEEVYSVNLTGATISAQTSISLLYQYCSKLPHDEYFNPMPNLYYVDDTEGIKCNIILPSNAPVHHVVGGPRSNVDAAKRDACLKACKKLHEIGALSDYLLPETEITGEESALDFLDCDDAQDEESSFVLQEMVVPVALKEPWSDVNNLVHLSSYFIRFEPRQDDRQYKEFGLFLKAPLPFEAVNMKIDLHLSRGRSVLTHLVPSGVTVFNEEEMLLALNFQEMCLKLILDRSDFMSDHVPLMTKKASESNSSIFYLMLPVIPPQLGSSISVDWMLIKRCLSSPIFTPLRHHLLDTDINLVNHLRLAHGCLINENDVLNSLVYVSHKKSFFFVSKILNDMDGFSVYKGSTSHVDHWSQNCDIHLSYPEQPLLRVKQLFCLHNLLHDRKSKNSEPHELEEHFFELPPELCELKIIGFSKDIGSTLSLLPSIMHRLENLLVAIELKDILSRSFAEGSAVTAERVLEALTTEKCQERFSLERLEVLGDAFLKFAVGRYLFLKHEAFDEGKLTKRRSNLVNNSNLCKLAIKNNLQGYIRDQEFVASQFFALGRPCPIICTKEKERVIHCESEITIRNRIENHQAKCSKNHIWLTKKTIADVVEALVGAYIVDSGFKAAIAFLKWFGIKVEFEVNQVCKAWTASSKFMSLSDDISVPEVETIMGHQFVHKGLILQAFVHPSYNRHGGGCYQRLEFLGDAVLDYLITSYLYSVFPDLKPGQLTDLRSSLVNNTSFARVAADALHKFIICDNKNLCTAIDKFVAFVRKPASETHLLEDPPCPKALGDLVESCMGAVLLDSGFDLNHVWKVMMSFLYPVMRFSNLQLSPIRELLELCQNHGWDSKFVPSKLVKGFRVEAIVEGENVHVTGAAIYRSTLGAKRMAAQQAIEKLKAQGFRLKSKTLEEILKTLRKMEPKLIGYDEIPMSLVGSLTLDHHSYSNMNRSPNGFASLESLNKNLTDSFPISKRGLNKATAKSRLMEFCVKSCWGQPVYECYKEEGASHLKLFTYKVVVKIEEAEEIIMECYGGPQSKKKAAAEEAAEGALWFLEEEGYIK